MTWVQILTLAVSGVLIFWSSYSLTRGHYLLRKAVDLRKEAVDLRKEAELTRNAVQRAWDDAKATIARAQLLERNFGSLSSNALGNLAEFIRVELDRRARSEHRVTVHLREEGGAVHVDAVDDRARILRADPPVVDLSEGSTRVVTLRGHTTATKTTEPEPYHVPDDFDARSTEIEAMFDGEDPEPDGAA